MAVSYSKACLIGSLMECMAYGIYFSLFIQSLNILRQKLVDRKLSFYLIITHLVLFVLITIRMVLDNMISISAFTDHPELPNAAEIRFTSYDGAAFRTGTYVALTIVADLFIVYRVYVVWNKNLRITAFPTLLAIADIIAGGFFLDTLSSLIGGESPTGFEIRSRILIFYSFTMALNVICTILIALRVWLIQRQVAGVKDGLVGAVMSTSTSLNILIESSVLYSATLIATIIPTALESNVQYCLLSALPGIIGISFSLIITRVGSGLSPDTAGPNSTMRFVGHPKSTIAGSTTLPTSEVGPPPPTNSQSQDVKFDPNPKEQFSTTSTRQTRSVPEV